MQSGTYKDDQFPDYKCMNIRYLLLGIFIHHHGGRNEKKKQKKNNDNNNDIINCQRYVTSWDA